MRRRLQTPAVRPLEDDAGNVGIPAQRAVAYRWAQSTGRASPQRTNIHREIPYCRLRANDLTGNEPALPGRERTPQYQFGKRTRASLFIAEFATCSIS